MPRMKGWERKKLSANRKEFKRLRCGQNQPLPIPDRTLKDNKFVYSIYGQTYCYGIAFW